MPPLRAGYFLLFAVYGAILPYVPVWLESRGLSRGEVGHVQAAFGYAILLSPVITTLLADAKLQNKTLLTGLFLVTAAAVGALAWASGFWWILAAYAVYSVAVVAVQPLLDGLFFAHREAMGTTTRYEAVRVWGTAGFILPSLGLFWWIRVTGELDATLAVAAGAAVVASFVALLLPRVQRVGLPHRSPSPSEPARRASSSAKRGLPTLDAAWRLFASETRWFALGTWLLVAATTAYYIYYPLYLTEIVGIDAQWIGLIACIGVGGGTDGDAAVHAADPPGGHPVAARAGEPGDRAAADTARGLAERCGGDRDAGAARPDGAGDPRRPALVSRSAGEPGVSQLDAGAVRDARRRDRSDRRIASARALRGPFDACGVWRGARW